MIPTVSGIVNKHTPAEVTEEAMQMVAELFTFLESVNVKPEQGGQFHVSISYVSQESLQVKQHLSLVQSAASTSAVTN